MKFCKKLLIILSVFVIHVHKAKPQEVASGIDNGTLSDSDGNPPDNPSANDNDSPADNSDPDNSLTPSPSDPTTTVMTPPPNALTPTASETTSDNTPTPSPSDTTTTVMTPTPNALTPTTSGINPDNRPTPSPSDTMTSVTTPTPNAATTNGMMTANPSGVIPSNPTSITASPPVRRDVVEYLNRRIKQVLRDNPERDTTDLKLAVMFNEKRATLEAALIKEPVQEDDDVRAEQALENFRNFMQEYNAIASKLESSVDDLTMIEQDAVVPVEVRYEALMLLLRLRDSSTIKDAEKALKLYEDFRQRLNGVQSSIAPPLSDEYRRYLEEILEILRKHVDTDDPKMQNFLQQLLQNPEQLKELAAALNELSEEDYDDEDYFWNLFSF